MRLLVALLMLAAFGSAPVALAASSPDAIAYEYRSINARYEIQRDSSVRVEERITISYEGTYHSLWRGISLGRAAVSNVEVMDADTGERLREIKNFPDLPNDKEHWGSYAWINDNGYFKVQWYYDAADTTKTWVLRYTLRGAVGFLEERDEFVWSLFSRYAVPVASSTVEVVLPGAVPVEGKLVGTPGSVMQTGDRTLRFEAEGIQPGGGVSFEAHWPKGVVHPPVRGFYLTNLVLSYGIAPLMAVLLLVCAATGALVFKFKKRP